MFNPFGAKVILKKHKNMCTFSVISQYKKMMQGDRLNKKDGLTRYGDSHVKDKTS